jgi:iron complex outermembrane receptor protein
MLLPGRLRLIGGSKFEHNDYTGFEYQPQVRGVWTPGKSHTVWASFSRAVRVPTRNNSDLQLVLPAGEQEGKPLFVEFDGDPTLTSEYIRAYEAGYRYQISQSISTDAAFYYNNYQHVIVSADPVPEIFPDRIVLRSPFINGADAQTHGAELSAKWNPIANWAIVAGITELRGSPSTLQGSPEHIFNIQLHANLPHRTEFNLALYHSGTVSLADGQVAQFNRVDTGVSGHLNSQWTFSVWGRNLQTAQHTETHTTFGDPVGYVPRSVAFAMVWRSQPEPQSSH